MDKEGQPTQKIIESRTDLYSGNRGEDAKAKGKHGNPPGINSLGTHGRWVFAEFIDIREMQEDFAAKVQEAFDEILEQAERNRLKE